jgi:pSer/pThr/pTyr-binding forkhead associated (FHA) protein
MPQLIIEELTRSGIHIGYHRVAELPVRIGRAFDNDIVLADQYVSPYHLVIEKNTDGLIIVDQGSDNGTFIGRNKRKKTEGAVGIVSGDLVIIGRTQLRIWSSTHQVQPAMRLPAQQSMTQRFVMPIVALVSLLIATAVFTLHLFLDTAKQTKLISLFANALPYLFFTFFWAGIWACAGFIILRKSQYSLQLIIANGALVAIILLTSLTEYIDYLSGSVKIADTVQYIVMALLLAILLFTNLGIATGIADLRRAMIALVIAGGVIAAIAVTDHAESFENRLTPEFSRTLKPPYFKITRSITIDRFIKENETLFGDSGKMAEKSIRE